jgi:hypothetical protein
MFEKFMQAIAQAQWDLNYSQFCIRAGFSYDDYSEGKWREFQTLAESLAKFDPRTLERICTKEPASA